MGANVVDHRTEELFNMLSNQLLGHHGAIGSRLTRCQYRLGEHFGLPVYHVLPLTLHSALSPVHWVLAIHRTPPWHLATLSGLPLARAEKCRPVENRDTFMDEFVRKIRGSS